MIHKNSLGLPFMKMHGLGNDFVVIDRREKATDFTAETVIKMADRHTGVGFDQLASIEACADADIFLTFWNADGSKSAACGNATRCIAHREMTLTGKNSLKIRTERGMLFASMDNELTAVNMGHPQVDWSEIPLAFQTDTLALPIEGTPTATGMGNPHCTFFVDNVMQINVETLGPQIEHHPLFPQRTNVQFATVIAPDRVRMRVWERGAGLTLASGSSSCATAVAAHRRGLTGRKVQVDLDGGTLFIDWRDDGVWMQGPTAYVFDGIWR